MKKNTLIPVSIVLGFIFIFSGCSEPEQTSVQAASKPKQENTQASSHTTDHTQLPPINTNSLDEIYNLAKSGKSLNSGDFAVGGNIEEVKTKWGSPSGETTKSGKLIFTYNSRGTEFVAVNGVIERISFYSSDLVNLSSTDITSKLGKPISEVEKNNSILINYLVENYKLIFVLSNPNSDHPVLSAVDIEKK